MGVSQLYSFEWSNCIFWSMWKAEEAKLSEDEEEPDLPHYQQQRNIDAAIAPQTVEAAVDPRRTVETADPAMEMVDDSAIVKNDTDAQSDVPSEMDAALEDIFAEALGDAPQVENRATSSTSLPRSSVEKR